MSINSLSNAALARRPDFEPQGRTPSSLSELAALTGPQPAPVNPNGQVGDEKASTTSTNTALQTITTYIPTEVLTLYVSAIAVLNTDRKGLWILFFSFLSATPLVVWIVFATKLKTSGKDIPIN